jgi:hypothetical protein
MSQLDLRLEDTDAQARAKRRIEFRTKWRTRVAVAIRERSLKIYNGEEGQDSKILCPANYGGYYCQWVAGHYGGCVLGREHPQTRYR